jgi:hypothetical protein
MRAVTSSVGLMTHFLHAPPVALILPSLSSQVLTLVEINPCPGVTLAYSLHRLS